MTTSRADLHLHTNLGDGWTSPARLVDEAVRRGLSVIAVTDHEHLEGVRRVEEIVAARGLDLAVVPGVEVSTRSGHLIGLFVTAVPRPMRPVEESIDAIKEQGGLVVVPHPPGRLVPSLSRLHDVPRPHRRRAARRAGRAHRPRRWPGDAARAPPPGRARGPVRVGVVRGPAAPDGTAAAGIRVAAQAAASAVVPGITAAPVRTANAAAPAGTCAVRPKKRTATLRSRLPGRSTRIATARAARR